MFTRNLLGWLLDRATDKSTNHPDRQFRDRLQVLTNLRDRDQPVQAALDELVSSYHDVVMAARPLRFNPGLTSDERAVLAGELAVLKESVSKALDRVLS